MKFIIQKRGAGREAAVNKYGLCGRWNCCHNEQSMCMLFPEKRELTFDPECRFYKPKEAVE